MENSANSYLTVGELSALLKVHKKTVYKMVGQGALPATRISGRGIRFRRENIDNWLRNRLTRTPVLFDAVTKIDLQLGNFDKIFLKGGHGNPVGNKTRWRYGFGIVYLRKTKQGNVRWYIEYNSGGRRRREVVANAQSREEAVLALKRRVAEIFDGKFNANRNAERIQFSQLADRYLNEYAMTQKKSWKSDESRLRNLIYEFGEMEIGRLSDTMILRYRQQRLGRGTSKLTTNRETALLKKMFSFAIEKGLMTNNPAKKIKMFSEIDTARTRVLSVEEEQRLFVELALHIRPIVLTALNTGLRYSEIVGLKWNDIDMERGKVKVEHTKSGKARFVPINSVLRFELERLSSGKKLVGRVFRSKSIRKGFENACRRAGIEGFVFHDLRRTFGTRLIERGVDIVTISRLYGHSSVLVTQRYLHPQDELGRDAVERLAISENLSHICHTVPEQMSTTLPVN